MPDLLDNPQSFSSALKHWLAKENMPTSLSSAQLKEIDAAIRRQSVFSARAVDEYFLDGIKDQVASIISPVTETRADRVTPENPEGKVTTGANPATARSALRQLLQEHGYAPAPDDKGTIKDLSSDERLNLVVKTNVQLAQGFGQFVQGNSPDAVDAMPAWELIRYEDRAVPRGERIGAKGAIVEDPRNGWPARFEAACNEAGDEAALAVLKASDRMVALKSSDVWQALGDGAGGFEDTLGNPYPPFAFNSGMWTEGVSYDECVDLGLIGEGDKVVPPDFDIAALFGAKEAT